MMRPKAIANQQDEVENPAAAAGCILERRQRLSASILWKLQRNFFAAQGIEAWRQATVPQYITSNPFIASAYAKVVFAFFRDCHAAAPADRNEAYGPLDVNQPIYIIELGSGSGRFAFHFLQRFLDLHRCSTLRHVRFTYVMTDFAERNLEYWSAHDRLRPFVEQGVLDFARFDAERGQAIKLETSGSILDAETPQNPIVLLANYVFDSLPQDAFYIQKGQLYESLITISTPQPAPDIDDPKLLSQLELIYENEPVSPDYYADADFNRILESYQQRLPDTTLLWPCAALRCVRYFQKLSGGRLLLLSGDKGYIREEALLERGEPGFSLHGSFSMMVNYHAIGQYFLHSGGQVLSTSYAHSSLSISAFLLGNHPNGYVETRLGYDEAIERAGPDDFFNLKKSVEKHYDAMRLEELLAFLRLSRWDWTIFLGCFDRLMTYAESASEAEQKELYRATRQVWETYFPIGEASDLAFYLGLLLYRIHYYPEALNCFQHSLRLYGPDASTFYNMAVCHYALRQLDAALDCLNQTLALDPTFEAAKGMRIKIEAEASQRSPQSLSR